MEIVLPDTSAWVEYLRETGSPVDLKLTALIESDADVCVTEPIAMELLAGAASEADHWDLRRMLAGLRLLPFDSISDFPSAAEVYRGCRARGFTPRSLLDCMIAAVAIRDEVAVLTTDVDFTWIAQTTDLRLLPAS